VLSGFIQDIAPATATKKLARLALPNAQEIYKSFKEEAAWRSKPQFRKKKMKRLIAIERDSGSNRWWNVYQDEKDHTWHEPVE
jgi:hypothetical protein